MNESRTFLSAPPDTRDDGMDRPASADRLTVEVPVPGRPDPERLSIPHHLLDLPLRDARSRLAEAFEIAYLNALLNRNRGRIGRTATQAGINPRTLYDKMRQFGMRKEDFKG